VREVATAFTPDIAAKLKWYVYRLIDPRNGETFYVGKGKGNRVFAHVKADLNAEDPSLKLQRIRQVQLAGLEVDHVIHRHGMDEQTAYQVEAALIDAYPGITNEVVGHGAAEFGVAHAQEIIRRYSAKQAVFKHRIVLINVNRSALERPLYEATRSAWKASLSKVRQAELVLAVRQGLIIGAFLPTKWMEVTAENFPERAPVPGRVGFFGTEAPPSLADQYLGRRVPDEYRKPGSANPIRYTWK
jgi:hypothetical protein